MPPPAVTDVRVDDDGITAFCADEVVLDVLFDERRIWSFWLHRDGEQPTGARAVTATTSPARTCCDGTGSRCSA